MFSNIRRKNGSGNRNDIRWLEFLITGMLSIIIRYPIRQEYPEQIPRIVEYLGAVIQDIFPEFYGEDAGKD